MGAAAGRGLSRAARCILRLGLILSLDAGDAVGGRDQVQQVQESHHAQDVDRALHPGRAVRLSARVDLGVRG